MSGGSYNYLCNREVEELFQAVPDLEKMRDRLIHLEYAPDVARETDEVILILRKTEALLQLRLDRLQKVWRAVEWWDSGDWSEDGLKKMLAIYRGDGS